MSEAKSPQAAFATPGTLYIVGTLCIGIFALLFGLMSPAAIPVVSAWCIAGGVGILISAVIDLMRGDILMGSICLVFGALIALGGGMTFYVAVSLPPEAIGAGLAGTGWFWTAIGLICLLILPNAGKASWSLFLMFIVLAAAVELMAIGLITGVALGTGIMSISGILFLVFGLYVMYAATVFITNTVYGQPKLPLGGPIFK